MARNESNDFGIYYSMLDGFNCQPWGALDKNDQKYDRHVPYHELYTMTRERDALVAQLKNRDAEIDWITKERDVLLSRLNNHNTEVIISTNNPRIVKGCLETMSGVS
jgi:hypothetical protein